MTVFNIISKPNGNKLANRILHNQEPLIDVTNEKYGRGDNTLTIMDYTYLTTDYDSIVNGKTVRLFITSTGELLAPYISGDGSVDAHIIPSIEAQVDSNFNNGYAFVPYLNYDDNVSSKVLRKLIEKDSTKMKITEKVVGMTFRDTRKFTEFAGEIDHKDNVPVCYGEALIIPEPSNPKDENALAVVAKMEDGTTHHLGYVSTKGELYHLIKAPTKVELKIMGYSVVGNYNDSYLITWGGK